MKETDDYTVDISNPPLFPPNRTFKDSFWFAKRETKESLERTKKWNVYIKKYSDEMGEYIQKFLDKIFNHE